MRRRPPLDWRARVRLSLTPPFHPWVRRGLLAAAALVVVAGILLAWLWSSYGRLIDAKMAGEQRPVPRIFARAVEVRPGDSLSEAQLLQRLNDLDYAQRPGPPAQPGEFSVDGTTVTILPRPIAREKARPVTVTYARPTSSLISRVSVGGTRTAAGVTLGSPLLAALAPNERRRYVPIANIPKRVIDAVIAIEDRRFYEHPGVDPIGAFGALVTNLSGTRPYLVGGSTITQQIVKNTFLTPAKTISRKLREQFMALVLESRFTKDRILELYLNDVVLGQRGQFEIHGVSEAARVFFDKDVRNVTLAEAATMAGLIQSPSRLSPFRNPERARERRNVVLAVMAENGFVTRQEAEAAAAQPLVVSTRAFENEAPYFVDYVSDLVDTRYAGLLATNAAVDVYTTLDLQMQRLAQEAVAHGMIEIDKQLAARKRPGRAQAALVAVDPRTGDILAMVGGRSYSSSQYNRAIVARRQPGSTFKPFVYLTAFEEAAAAGRTDVTPATVVADEPTVFKDGENDYAPVNYQNEYDGPITLRRALALSRNVVAIKVAEMAGYDRVAALWKRVGVGTAKPFPSIALGVFEATPMDMAEAYTIFTNGGSARPLEAVTRIVENGTEKKMAAPASRPVARADTTYLVTDMMRAVMNEGTGAGARARGFTLDAAGKSGTTNDLRDAWFIGFTPELLTVVWVGFDNNQTLGLSGSQAALPIWTEFMKRALAGQKSQSFTAPDGIVFTAIDKDTGQLASPLCPTVITQPFLAGTEPTTVCELHRPASPFVKGVSGLFGRIGRFFKGIGR